MHGYSCVGVRMPNVSQEKAIVVASAILDTVYDCLFGYTQA
jgi:hypothetical protein